MGISTSSVAVRHHSRLDVKATGGPDIPEYISTRKFHFVPRASTVPRRFHCSPEGFSVNLSSLWQTMVRTTQVFIRRNTREHQQPLIHLFVSLAARTSWSGINSNTDSPNMHEGAIYGVPSKYWNGVLPSGRTVNLKSTNPK